MRPWARVELNMMAVCGATRGRSGAMRSVPLATLLATLLVTSVFSRSCCSAQDVASPERPAGGGQVLGAQDAGGSGPGQPSQTAELPPIDELHVVIVNDISSHWEVLAGVLHILRRAGLRRLTTLYTGAGFFPFDVGFFKWVPLDPPELEALQAARHAAGPGLTGVPDYAFNTSSLGEFINIRKSNAFRVPSGLTSSDLVICISPELARGECREVIKATKPAHVVSFVHRADMLHGHVTDLAPREQLSLVALAPHVARSCEKATGRLTTWIMPTAPFAGPREQACPDGSCLSDFSLQGSIRRWSTAHGSGYTRNYAGLWKRMLELKQQEGLTGNTARVLLLGRGAKKVDLGIPYDVYEDVEHLEGAPYPEFWGRIQGTLALLPCFGLQTYLVNRLSSTISASIITATPIIASRQLLAVYTFLSEDHVILREDAEDEAAAMYRVMAMPRSEVIRRRHALVALRDRLNAAAIAQLRTWLVKAATARAAQAAQAAEAANPASGGAATSAGGSGQGEVPERLRNPDDPDY